MIHSSIWSPMRQKEYSMSIFCVKWKWKCGCLVRKYQCQHYHSVKIGFSYQQHRIAIGCFNGTLWSRWAEPICPVRGLARIIPLPLGVQPCLQCLIQRMLGCHRLFSKGFKFDKTISLRSVDTSCPVRGLAGHGLPLGCQPGLWWRGLHHVLHLGNCCGHPAVEKLCWIEPRSRSWTIARSSRGLGIQECPGHGQSIQKKAHNMCSV